MSLTQIQPELISGIPETLALKANTSSLAAIVTSGSASDLISGTLPSNRIGAGTPITFSTGVSTAEVSLGSTANTWYDAFTITLTTKRANSIILVDALLSVDRSSGNYPAIQTRIHAYKNGVSSGIIQTLQYSEYEGNVQEHHIGRSPIQGWHTSAAIGDVWTYYIQAANQSGSTPSGTYSGYVNRYGSSTGFAMEIAV